MLLGSVFAFLPKKIGKVVMNSACKKKKSERLDPGTLNLLLLSKENLLLFRQQEVFFASEPSNMTSFTNGWVIKSLKMF